MVAISPDDKFIIPPFNGRDGNLYIYNINLVDAARERGTPLLITSEEILEKNYFSIQNAFKKHYKNFRINYAVKANSNPSILSIFRKLGSGADIASLGELFLARFAGFEKEKIMMTSNFSSKDMLEFAMDSGITLNFDDVDQLELIKPKVPDIVSFRINPGIGGGEFPGIVTGGHGSKFGIPEEFANKAYRYAMDLGVKRFGIHMHGGSNNLDVNYFKAITEKFFTIARDLEKSLKIEFEFIDIGGGFGVPYRSDEEPLDMNAVAENVIENFNNQFSGKSEPLLMVEPGRYLVANSTVLLGKVTTIKNYDKKIIGTDIGMNLLIRPALYNAYHHITIANRLNARLNDDATIVGQVCENTDKIAEQRKFPIAESNDILCVFNAGAYVYSMSSNYNGFLRPEEILVSKDSKIYVIRERENYPDLIRNVKMPAYLYY